MGDPLQIGSRFASSYELSALSAATFHFVLTLFVLSRDLRSNVNRVYVVWGVSLTVWNLATFFKYSVTPPHYEDAVFWLRILHVSVIFLPISILHLCLLIARVSKPRLIRTLWVIYITFAASVFTKYYIAGIDFTDYGPIVKGGPAFRAYFICYLATTLSTITFLYVKQRDLTHLDRTRLRALLLALVTLVALGVNDLMLVFRIRYYPGTRIPFFPLGNIGAIFFGVVIAYSVLQHQLLNIHVTLSRIAAQLVRISFLFLLGIILLIIAQLLMGQRLFPAPAFYASLGVLVTSACMASLLFPRLFGKGEEKLERRILGDRFEYQEKVVGFIQAIPSYSQAEHLLDDLNQLLVSTMQVKSYQIILLEESKRVFSVYRSHPPQPAVQIPELTLDSPIFHLFKCTKADSLAYKIAYAMPGESSLERSARLQLKQFDPEFCFPFFSGEDPFGLLLIGEKVNGEPYTEHDSQLLSRMVKNLGLILNQMRLKKQVLLAEQMELLGTLSRGMAHDLNNLITPIWTYLQMAAAGVKDAELTEELLPDAIRNLETIRSYIKESLFFSKTQSLQLSQFQLDKAIRVAIELIQPQLKRKGVSALTYVPPNTVVEMDEVLIQRLIGNLLSNAIDASAANAEINVRVQRLGKTETDRDWLRLMIIDHGEGISSENLKRVQTPYFTTKDRGTKSRGFGLGLAICRKIVHLHGGHFSIASEPKKGTTVQVDLPDRQNGRSSLTTHDST
jgi:signal transduction histidine kinase